MSYIKFNNNCSSQYVYKIGDVVIKKHNLTNAGWGRFKNEINFLHNFSNYKYFPKLLRYDITNFKIYMTYCGCNLNKSNLPDDWENQITEISDILKLYNIELLDLQEKNITCLNENIYLIDFDTYRFNHNFSNFNRLYNIFKNI
jgi:predicted Ser/Thr protein kinase